MEGIYGEDGGGLCFEDGFDGGKDAGLLFIGREWNCVGAGRFAAYVEDFGSFFEHLEGLIHGAVGGGLWRVEMTAIGEGVGGDVEDAHDDGPLAEG